MSAMVVAAVDGLVAVVTWNIRRGSKVDWARTVAIPRIEELRGQASWLAWAPHSVPRTELIREVLQWLDRYGAGAG